MRISRNQKIVILGIAVTAAVAAVMYSIFNGNPLGVSPMTCSYEGKVYKAGEGFPSSDGCNTCGCSADGQVFCTLKFCIPN
ncbi:MAG: hypothetical protein JNK26_03150 [Candidatus Doudnabacteria bacterium]|nr:hypothetical protein [Candidatus Doudnabacteria bacterium]